MSFVRGVFGLKIVVRQAPYTNENNIINLENELGLDERPCNLARAEHDAGTLRENLKKNLQTVSSAISIIYDYTSADLSVPIFDSFNHILENLLHPHRIEASELAKHKIILNEQIERAGQRLDLEGLETLRETVDLLLAELIILTELECETADSFFTLKDELREIFPESFETLVGLVAV